jgi:hypothetical protein
MNKYVAFYNDKRIAVTANSLFQARAFAAKQMKVPTKKTHLIAIVLTETNGNPVEIPTASL